MLVLGLDVFGSGRRVPPRPVRVGATDLPMTVSRCRFVHRPQSHSILVVEDEPSIASFVAMYLKRAGFAERVAASGEAAIEQAEAQAPSIIVLDLMLPDLDGIDVCRRLRQRSDVPILMLTARDDDVDKIIGLEVGADDYLT